MAGKGRARPPGGLQNDGQLLDAVDRRLLALLGDYARTWELSVSGDGTGWRTVARGTGVGQLTNIDVRRTSARYVRITSTGAARNWWSIADFRLYN